MAYVPNPHRHTLPYLMGRLADKDRIQGATSNINSTSIEGTVVVEPGGHVEGLPLEDIPVDTEPPPAPSPPMLSLSIGMVDVHWDGLGANGEGMPTDWHFTVPEYRMGAGEWTAGPAMSGKPGWVVLTGLPAGVVEVRLVTVDTTGNRSEPSIPSSLQVIPVETAAEVRADLEEADRQAQEDLATLNDFMESGEISLDRIGTGEMKATTADAVFAGLAVVDRLTVGTQAWISGVLIEDDAITAEKMNFIASTGSYNRLRIDSNGILVERGSLPRLRIDGNGLVGLDGSGQTTFSIDGTTGSAFFGGTIDAVGAISTGQDGSGYSAELNTTGGAGLTLRNNGTMFGRIYGDLSGSHHRVQIRAMGGTGSVPGVYLSQSSTNSAVLLESGNGPQIAVTRTSVQMNGGGDSYFLGNSSNAIMAHSLTRRIRVTAAGTFFDGPITSFSTYYQTATGYDSVVVDADGNFYRGSSSARRYKLDIKPLEIDDDALLSLRPVDWIDKGEHERAVEQGVDPTSLARVPGLIAEDVHDAGLTAYVRYGPDGEVDGLYYDRMIGALILTGARLRDRITALETTLEELTA